jgi:hypothetical protein
VLLWLRRMIHSTSLRAAGSLIAASICVACSVPPWCRVSIARLTSATFGSEGSGAEAAPACVVLLSSLSATADFCLFFSLDLATFFPSFTGVFTVMAGSVVIVSGAFEVRAAA